MLFGVAAALKYSNAIFALAALPLAFTCARREGGGRLRAGLAYVAGGAVAVAAFAGPWFLALWREFGNPVFPLMNAWFAGTAHTWASCGEALAPIHARATANARRLRKR